MAPRSQAPERGEDASASFTLPRVWPLVTAAPGASHDALSAVHLWASAPSAPRRVGRRTGLTGEMSRRVRMNA